MTGHPAREIASNPRFSRPAHVGEQVAHHILSVGANLFGNPVDYVRIVHVNGDRRARCASVPFRWVDVKREIDVDKHSFKCLSGDVSDGEVAQQSLGDDDGLKVGWALDGDRRPLNLAGFQSDFPCVHTVDPNPNALTCQHLTQIEFRQAAV